jgi:hypothetical protein
MVRTFPPAQVCKLVELVPPLHGQAAPPAPEHLGVVPNHGLASNVRARVVHDVVLE